MTTSAEERIAGLAEVAANALAAACASLGLAADRTDEVDTGMRRSEADVDELHGAAQRLRFAEDPAPALRYAQGLAEHVESRIKSGLRGLQEVGDHLGQGALALKTCREVLTELHQEDRQGGGGTTEILQQRLEHLERAVGEARDGIEEATQRLSATRRNLEPLLYPSGHLEDPHRTAAAVQEVSDTVRHDVMSVHHRLTEMRDDFDVNRPRLAGAAQQAVDLAIVARAATNPTPAAGQGRSGGMEESSLRRRLGSAGQGPGQER